jgi:hypothetical protein
LVFVNMLVTLCTNGLWNVVTQFTLLVVVFTAVVVRF